MRGGCAAACVATVAWLLGGVACRRVAESPGGPADPRADARIDGASRAAESRRDAGTTDAEAVVPDEDDAAVAARLNGLICKRPRCCVTRVMPAGVGSDGTRYTVVRVDLLPGRRRCGPPRTGEQEDVVDPEAIKANEGGEFGDKQRERYRWDLVAERSGKVTWRQAARESTTGRAGDFGMGGGEDSMSADAAARTITYSRAGGSAVARRRDRDGGPGSVARRRDVDEVLEFAARQPVRRGLELGQLRGQGVERDGLLSHQRAGRRRRSATPITRRGDHPDGHVTGRVRESRLVDHRAWRLRGVRGRESSAATPFMETRTRPQATRRCGS